LTINKHKVKSSVSHRTMDIEWGAILDD